MPIIFLVVQLAILLTLEIIYYRKDIHKIELISSEFKESENNKNIPIYSIQEVIAEKAKKKFVIYENLLIDIEKYIEEHPGGRNLLGDMLYQDISRYITGNQAFSSKISAYEHSTGTQIFSIKNISYAKIKDQHGIILDSNAINQSSSYVYDSMNFVGNIAYVEDTGKICVKKTGLIFPNFIKGFNWTGRHFSISSKKLNKTRYYSICICLNEVVQKKIKHLISNITLLEENQKIEPVEILEEEKYSNEICFYIKSYNIPKALSHHINNIHKTEKNFNEDFILRGPIVIY